MDNAQIADSFSLLAKLSDVHGENSFKVKAYSSAAFTIDKLTVELSEVPREKLFSIKGIGESTGNKVIELLETGEMAALNLLIEKTPEGILEMLTIKGIGPKKIATIWKEMEIETVGELLYACKENRLKLYKGFGEKTQLNVIETLEYYLKSKGSFLFAQVETIISPIESFFAGIFNDVRTAITGTYKRHFEIIDELELVIEASIADIVTTLTAVDEVEILEENATDILLKTPAGLKIRVYGCDTTPWIEQVFYKSCSPEFEVAFRQQFPAINYTACANEEAIFSNASINFIPAFLRESPAIIAKAAVAIPDYIKTGDIRGIIHSHSDWSDGNNTLEEMANAAIAKGLEYLVISDHSKSAFYANGLKEDRIKAQHHYIDELNNKLAPFKIFKSIESDILNDGNLDYSEAILATFDLVIASVHSNLKMSEDKAMLRLLNAIKNPYTTILGHMTGRLLLSRKGYPVNHHAIIDACAASNVVIELNAHPSRLDIDWRHIEYALEKKVMISINPDAHRTEGFDDTKYGIMVAQKALLTKEQNLSSFGLKEFETFLSNKKLKQTL
jgi:DNA polymerase (family 10)